MKGVQALTLDEALQQGTMESPRRLKIHWFRQRNLWSVVFSDHCEHYKRLVIRGASLETVLSDKAPRAFLKGRGRLIRHGSWAEVVA